MFIRQEGDRLEGTGEKWWVNGVEIDAPIRTPMTLVGTVAGTEVRMTFVEKGARLESRGSARWAVGDTAETMLGQFASTAANSSGRSEMRRVERQSR